MTTTFEIGPNSRFWPRDGELAPGGQTQSSYLYYEAAECERCHDQAATGGIWVELNQYARGQVMALGLVDERERVPELNWSDEYDGAICERCETQVTA